MWIIISQSFLKWFTPKNIAGITIFPFIFIKSKGLANDQVFVNHERIHIHQQLELFILFFYLWYSIEYFIRLIQYRNANLAYKNISFEREAYANEKNQQYILDRKIWAFIKYL
ncbi:MAG: hypothetical protein H6553_03865 [Chitinophagales bacterium]|nr:hypothetical protein [Chitinophagales bacterium]